MDVLLLLRVQSQYYCPGWYLSALKVDYHQKIDLEELDKGIILSYLCSAVASSTTTEVSTTTLLLLLIVIGAYLIHPPLLVPALPLIYGFL